MLNNKVVIAGKVCEDYVFDHNVGGEKFYLLKVETVRDSGNIDILPIMVSEWIAEVNENVLGKQVCIKGSVRTYNQKDGLSVRQRTFVFADEVLIVDMEEPMFEVHDGDLVTYSNNWVMLSGNLCKKSEFRTTPGGRQLVNAIIAVNRDYNKSDYIPCLFWGKAGHYIDSLEIGHQINIRGRLQSRTYTKNDELKETYEVSVDKVMKEQ